MSELAYIKQVGEHLAGSALQDPRPLQLDGLTTRQGDITRSEYDFRVDSVTKRIKEQRRIAALPVSQAYLGLKVLSDQWISQIQADIRRKNSKKPYKTMDNILKEQSLVTAKTSAAKDTRLYYLGKVDDELVALSAAVNLYLNGGQMAAFGEVPIPGAGDVIEIFTGIAEQRKGKADALVEMLESMRLAPLNDLLPAAKSKD